MKKNEPFTSITREYHGLWADTGLELTEGLSLAMARALRRPKKVAAPRMQQPAPASLTTLESVQEWLGDCRRCGLCNERKNIVFGQGTSDTRLMFVGEGPGADEDMQGLPFVGKAGQLLTKILEAMEYRRENVYIANIVKCRPPNNRVPLPEEVAQCLPFLKAQIELIQPNIIVALGLTAATNLTGTSTTMSNLRGRFYPLAWNPSIRVLPTYHPAYLLRNPEAKRTVWADMKLVLAQMGRTL